MLNTNDRITKHKVGLLNLAEALGNVSKACQMMGLSRDTFYRYKNAVEEGGVESLLDLKNRTDPAVEESQVQARERKKLDDEVFGEIGTAHPGYLGSQDTFYVGTLKGVGRVYPWSDTRWPYSQDLPLLHILTERGTEYYGRAETHD